MSSLRPRRALILAAALLGAAASGRALALLAAERAITARGLSWGARQTTLTTASWRDLSGPGLSADSLDASLLPSPRVVLRGLDLDLSTRLSAQEAEGSGLHLPGASHVALTVEDASVRWGDRPLVAGLSGPLLPEPDLRADNVRLHKDGQRWVGELSLPLSEPPLTGTLHLSFLLDADGADVDVDVPDAALSHPTLAPGPLGPLPVRGHGRIGRDGAFSGEGQLSAVPLRLRGVLGLHPEQLDAHLGIGPADLGDVVDLFAGQVPEAARATLGGTLGLDLDLTGPPWRWRAQAHADQLLAPGALSSSDALRIGAFTWSAPTEDGGVVARRTGEGTPDWVPLSEAGPMPAAVIAAEDAGFWKHPGYDLEAVQEALSAWSEGEERPRGGSTLTQQLAKNLYLSGDRTLLRKLRELLLALDLERTLGKRRILELYLNVVEFGPGIYGIGPAAKAYFLKSPSGLTWHEAAFLAAILPAPRSLYQEALIDGHPPRARVERVLDNLAHLGEISAMEAEKAKAAPLLLLPPP